MTTRLKSTPNPEALKGTHVPPTNLRATLGLLLGVPLWLCRILLLEQPKNCVSLASLTPIKPSTHTHPPFPSPFPSLPVAHVLPRRGPTNHLLRAELQRKAGDPRPLSKPRRTPHGPVKPLRADPRPQITLKDSTASTAQ